MADSSSDTHQQLKILPAISSHASVSYACVAHLRHARAARRPRPLWSSGLFVGSFCILGFISLLTGSVWMLINTYSTEIISMGKNFSHVYTANSFFVKNIIVTNRFENEGPIVYSFSRTPLTHKQINWTELYVASVKSGSHQGWGFWLNTGSQVELQYNLSDSSLQLLLVVVQGEENMQKWVSNQSRVDLASTWTAVQGTGAFHYEVETDQKYFFAFRNAQLEDAQVDVQIDLRSRVHSSENYKSKCHLTSANCAVYLDYLASSVLLLTTPVVNQGVEHAHGHYDVRYLQEDGDSYWSVTVAFERRSFTYLVFWGALAIVLLILFMLCRPSSADMDVPVVIRDSAVGTMAPCTVSQEDGDKVLKAEQSESCSIIFSDDDLKDTKDSEIFLCIICFDQQRNSYFDPCGHCATCYACSMKIAKEKKAVCPLCRQPIRLVRRMIVW